MAWKAPGWTKAVAVANGTNNFVLSDPSSPGPYRTDVQANADGSLPNGSTVHYVAWRTTTTGDAEAEEGVGTYTLATRVVTRTAGNVIDGSAGPGTLVDFGLSGQMDVFFLGVLDGSNIPASAADAFADNIGAARKNANNTHILQTNGIFLQDYRNTDTGSSAAAQIRTFGDVANLTISSNSSTRTGTRFGSAISSRGEVLGVGTPLNIGTTGSNNILFGTNSALVAQITAAGVFQDAGGRKFVAFPTGGTVKMLFSSVPPTGWTRVNETNQAVIRLDTVSDTPNDSGGSDSLFDGAWSTAGHTLTESQIPSHTHTIPGASGSGGSVDGGIVDGFAAAPNFASGATGGGGSHAHAMTTPYYRIACWATFD
jgi:hypothetical protein